MNYLRFAFLAILCLSLSGTAQAAFVVTAAGPLDSTGPQLDSGNAVLFPTYSGAVYPCDVISFSGTLTKVNPASLASDSWWWFHAFTGFNFWGPVTTVGAYNAPLNITDNTNGLFWIKNYPQYRFEAFEAVDDPGVDAQWTNVNITFHSLVPTIGTSLGNGTTVVMDTGGSTFNTQLALYSADGTLLAQDDDGGGGNLSRLNAGVLDIGSYYLVAGGFQSTFYDNWATPGADSGGLNININGASVFNGSLDAERFKVIQFDVVPEPATLVALAAAAILVLCHRRVNQWLC